MNIKKSERSRQKWKRT